jgi:extracellular factor (EF) 3-hydroxypalmitic acid methyl ester biosynthesis protein
MNKQLTFFNKKASKKTLEKIKPLLSSITNSRDMKVVDDFWEKVSNYFGVLFGIDNAIEDGQIGEEAASKYVINETNEILLEAKKLEESLHNSDLIRKIKKLFRECGIPVGMKSEIVKHAFVKPRGYAGDYGLIEIVYNDKIISKGFGYCADKRLLIDDYAYAVRGRKDMMKELLVQYLKSTPLQSVEILNIACGSCREIREMFAENSFDGSKNIIFTLVDQDQEALDFSREKLADSPPNVEYNFLQHSVYNFVKEPERYREVLRDKDLVYTIGLADYIPEETLRALILFLFSLVKPGGKLVIAHKDSKNFSPLAADWWCDWTFHLRNESEMVDLVKTSGISNFSLTIQRETKANIIFFLVIEKK